jgi:DNA-binding CsgD family transcriptional regulator
LYHGNIRWSRWSALLLWPLALIVGDLRLLWQDYSLAGFDSVTLEMFGYGVGMAALALLPQRRLRTAVKTAAVACALLLAMQYLLAGMGAAPGALTAVFVAFQVANGFCMGGAYFVFFYTLRNVERLIVVVCAQLYYAVVVDLLWDFEWWADLMKGPVSVACVALLVVVAFFGDRADYAPVAERAQGPGRGEYSVFVLDVSYFLIGAMMIYLEFEQEMIDSRVFAVGSLIAVAVVLAVQLKANRSVYHMWNAFLALSMAAMVLLLLKSQALFAAGTVLYGVGDGIGYIGICYIIGGAARHNCSYRFLRTAMVVWCAEYCLISPAIDWAFANLELPINQLTLAGVALCVLVGLMAAPLLSKNLFLADWSDGYRALDMGAYAAEAKQVEVIVDRKELDLTPRERQVFTLLLSGRLLKQIARELSVSYSTVNFHTNNLYRKLGVSGRAELAAKYHAYTQSPGDDTPGAGAC